MKSIIVYTFAIVWSVNVICASIWAARMNGNKFDYARSVAYDYNGNIVVVGSYDSVTLEIYDKNDISAAALTKNGSSGAVFVAKYDQNGTVLWTAKIGGDNYDDAFGVACDTDGNIAVIGRYSSTSLEIYDKDYIVATSLNNSGTFSSAFVVKYDQNGTVIWAARMDGLGDDDAQGVAFDNKGNIIVVGQFFSTQLDVYDKNDVISTFLLNNGTFGTAFMAKFNQNGMVLWAARMDGDNDDSAFGVACDKNDNIVVVGDYYSSSLQVYNKNDVFVQVLNNNGSAVTAFIAKYDENGTVLWASRLDGDADESAKSVSIDQMGNIIVVGKYSSSSLQVYNRFDVVNASVSNNGSSGAAFIVKYFADGGISWVARMDGDNDDVARDVDIDNNGNIVVAGMYSSTSIEIYGQNGDLATTLINNGSSYAAFIVKYDSNGNVLLAYKIDGDDTDGALAVACDVQGSIAVVGYYYSSTLDIFDSNQSSVTFLKSNGTDPAGFLAFYQNNQTNQFSSLTISTASSQVTSSIALSLSQTITTLSELITLSSTIFTSSVINQSTLQVLTSSSSRISSQSFEYSFSNENGTSTNSVQLQNNNNTVTDASSDSQNVWNLQLIIIIAGSSFLLILVLILLKFYLLRRKTRKGTSSYTNPTTATTLADKSSIQNNQSAFSFNNTTAVVSQMPLSIPGFLQYKFGVDFRIQTQIARGGLSKIYSAYVFNSVLKESIQSTEIVVKVLDESHKLSQKQIDAFYQEIGMYYRFQSYQTFPKIYAYSDNPYSIVMKCYNNGSLKDLIYQDQNQNYKIKTCVSILLQFSTGIMTMHNNGFVHLDIKPDNVLLDYNENGEIVPIITDFGISRMFDESKNQVFAFKLNQLNGLTLGYAAPEMIRSFRLNHFQNGQELMVKCDVYSISIMMFEMITRRKAW